MGNSDKDFEKSNQCAFDAYCKVILRNEARDAYDQRKRKLKREQLFGEMSPEELSKLITTDRYFQFERDIVEDGLHFIVCDQGVYDALMTLPGAKRKIILVNLGMTIKDGMQGGGGQLAGAIAMIVGGGIVIAASVFLGSLDTSFAG